MKWNHKINLKKAFCCLIVYNYSDAHPRLYSVTMFVIWKRNDQIWPKINTSLVSQHLHCRNSCIICGLKRTHFSWAILPILNLAQGRDMTLWRNSIVDREAQSIRENRLDFHWNFIQVLQVETFPQVSLLNQLWRYIINLAIYF